MTKTKEPSSISVLVRIPVFRRLWAAISISSLGDWLGLLATTSLAAYLTRESSGIVQGAAVSGVLLTRLAPDLLLGPVAGALVDRIDRRKIAVIGDALAGLLYLSIAFAGNLTWLLVAQFLVEAIGLFTNPAKQAMWVNIVPRERLAVANQLNYVSIYGMVPVAAAIFALLSTVAQFFGAAVATGAADSSALISGPTSSVAINIALIIDAATYFFCSFTVLISRHMIPAFVGERSSAKSIFSLIAEGVSFVKNSKVMRALYLGILGAFGAGGLTAGVAQAYVSSLGAGNAGYGILFGSVFTGLALGMLTGPKVLPTIPRRMIFTSAIGASGLVLIVMSTLQDFLGASIASALMGWFAGIAWITGFTMIGHEVSDQLRGRVFGFVMSSVRLTLLGTIAAGPVIAGVVGSHILVIGGFSWGVSGAAIVLAGGGLIAILVSAFAARQIGGVASSLLRRIFHSRRPDLLKDQADQPGVLIAVEGADPAVVEQTAAAIGQRLRVDGWVVIDPAVRIPDSATDSETQAGALRAAADLSEQVVNQVFPALQDGAVVLRAGYVDELVVRFGVLSGLGEEPMLRMGMWAVDGLYPNLTILVDGDGAPDGGVLRDSNGAPAAADSAADLAADSAADSAGDSAGASAGDELMGAESGVDSPSGSAAVTPAQAYRDRASSAPERYLILPDQRSGEPGDVQPADEDRLTSEVWERIASVLRQHAPRRAGDVAADATDGADAAGDAGADVAVAGAAPGVTVHEELHKAALAREGLT